jgi:hypothetical protein
MLNKKKNGRETETRARSTTAAARAASREHCSNLFFLSIIFRLSITYISSLPNILKLRAEQLFFRHPIIMFPLNFDFGLENRD